MAQPYVGEIRMFGGNFAPAGWMFCNGQLLAISEYDTLFNLIGTTYGGDGQQTFALPNLQSQIPLHQGNGFTLAAVGGTEAVTLTVNQIPSHNHMFSISDDTAGSTSPAGGTPAASETPLYEPAAGIGAAVPLNAATIGQAGGNQPHSNLQPYLCVSFIISLFGTFPFSG
jgi:microcystin-dependent protein